MFITEDKIEAMMKKFDLCTIAIFKVILIIILLSRNFCYNLAVKRLMPFPRISLCKKRLTLVHISNKYRNTLQVEAGIRFQLNDVDANITTLVAKPQHQPLH